MIDPTTPNLRNHVTDPIIDNQTLPVKGDDKRNTVIRVVHNRENPFVQLNKQALWDSNLSLKAVGLWARCMSRPNDWTFCIKELVGKCKEGRKAVDSAMQELIEARYAYRLELDKKGEDGKFTHRIVEYVFFEFPATDEEIEEQKQVFKKFHRDCRFGNLRDGNLQKEHLLIKSTTETEASTNKEEEHTSLMVPKEPPPIVGSVGVSDPPKVKNKKEAPEFSAHVREVSSQMIRLLTEHNPVYRPPGDLTKFMNQVRIMLEDENQRVNDVLETFAWAAADNIKRDTFNGWQSVICRNKRKGKVSNPAEIFREHFASINSQMKSKKPRKFAEYSDDKVLAQQAIEMAEGFI